MCESERHVTVLVPPFKFLLIETTDSNEGCCSVQRTVETPTLNRLNTRHRYRHPRFALCCQSLLSWTEKSGATC